MKITLVMQISALILEKNVILILILKIVTVLKILYYAICTLCTDI